MAVRQHVAVVGGSKGSHREVFTEPSLGQEAGPDLPALPLEQIACRRDRHLRKPRQLQRAPSTCRFDLGRGWLRVATKGARAILGMRRDWRPPRGLHTLFFLC